MLVAAMGVLYYTIYNPSHHRRDKHDAFEVYKLTQGQYVRQQGNPIWMPEIGLGIGHERGRQDGIERDWLYWYDAAGDRHLAPEDALAQERILRGREQLMRQQLEAELGEERIQRSAAERELAQERRSMALKMLQENIPIATIARITELTIAQLQDLQSQG
jgi:hypothetical protein